MYCTLSSIFSVVIKAHFLKRYTNSLKKQTCKPEKSGKPFSIVFSRLDLFSFCNRVSLASSASLGPCCTNLPNHLIQGWQTPPGLLGLAIVVAVVIVAAAMATNAVTAFQLLLLFRFALVLLSS